MQTEDKRVNRTRWSYAGDLAVQVEVDAVIPIDDPSDRALDQKRSTSFVKFTNMPKLATSTG